MLLLAIDTSGKQGSIAIAQVNPKSADDSGAEVVAAVPLTGGTFSAQLIPQIADLLSNNGFAKRDIGAFAVASGPGSFTGLRIGLAAVKALSEILEKPIAPVSLLELCVFMSGSEGPILAAMDAGRGDVYVGEYQIPSISDPPPQEYMLSMSEFIAQAKGWTLVTPDPALAQSITKADLPIFIVPPISAADIAHFGWRKIQSGHIVTPELLEANYIRRTDAEMIEKKAK